MSSGLFAQVGLKKEATYGVRVVPDHFIEFRSENLQGNTRFFQSMQLGAGTTFPRGSRRVPVTQDAGGPIPFEFPNKGGGVWLDLLHGNTVTPVQQGGTPAYLQTHDIGLTSATKSATIQIGRPSTDGVVRPFDYTGSMVTEANFSWAVDDALLAAFTFDSQKEDTAQTLATRSLPSGLASFVYTQGQLTIGGSPVAHVTTGNLGIALPRQTDFYPLDTTGLKSKPIVNAMSGATGTATVRFTDLTAYNRYKNNTKPALVLTFTGAQISGIYSEQITITCPMVGFTGETPNVAGPDVLVHNIPFNVFWDGSSAPLTIAYTATDTAL